MSMFRDANGTEWFFEIKFRHVEEIKRFCKGKDGKPLDILTVLERGHVDELFGDTETMFNIVFVLCYEKVREQFNLAEYDESQRENYEMFPELKTENAKIKASRWFGGLLDGQALTALGEAFQDAMVNFCPNQNRKEALRKILEKSKEVDKIQSEEMIQQIDEAAAQVIPQIRAETRKQIQESVSDVLSGNWQESRESSPTRSASGS